jgi:hypothetical protein
MAVTEREFHRSHRRVHAVRVSPTADRPWHHPGRLTDVVLAFFVAYVIFILANLVAALP